MQQILDEIRIDELNRALDEQSRMLERRNAELSRLTEQIESLQLQVIGWQSAAKQSFDECQVWKDRYKRIWELYVTKRSA